MGNAFRAVPEDGYLREWLAVGPFCGAPPDLFSQSILPEREIIPSAGEKADGRLWSSLKSDQPVINLIELTPQWESHTYCCSYAHVYIMAPETMQAVLALGSDDGAMVWLNGRRIFAVEAMRSCEPDRDRITVELVKGWNRILVKILQYGGGWGFTLRFLGADGYPVPDLSYALNNPGGIEGHSVESEAYLNLDVETTSSMELARTAFGDKITFRIIVQNFSQFQGLPGIAQIRDALGNPLACLEYPALLPLQKAVLSMDAAPEAWAEAWKVPFTAVLSRDGRRQSLEVKFSPDCVTAFLLSTVNLKSSTGIDGRLSRIRRDIAGGLEAVKGIPGLLDAIRELLEGMFSREDLEPVLARIERIIQSEAERVKNTAIYLIGHAHIDMNWLWRWPETIQVCRDTFRQALRFMDEFPDFIFSQSQASCYAAMEDEEPELFNRIRTAVANGRWNITGGMWTEGDTNLSSGEALARSLLLAQTYFKEKFGIRAKVGWLPDNFGHAAQLPQLLLSAGIDSFYHMRCNPPHQLYWWESPDGSRVLAKTGQGYNGNITPSIRNEPAALPQRIGAQMYIYGVGDHGGGPTRKDILAAKVFGESRLFPEIKFSSADEYFAHVRPKAEGIHVHRGELGYIFEGCYTSVARIKEGNRLLENALQSAEALACAANFLGEAWPRRELEETWKILVFNEFHDILPGSAIHESNCDSVGKYARGLESARKVRMKALRQIAERINIDNDVLIPLAVFNTLAWKRSEIVTAEIVTTEACAGVRIFDPCGGEAPAQIVRTRAYDNCHHLWVQFYAKDVPALGYQVYRAEIIPCPPEVPVTHWSVPYPVLPQLPPYSGTRAAGGLTVSGNKIRSRFLEAEFDPGDGALTGLRMIAHDSPGPDILGTGGANRLCVYLERENKMNAWNLDPEPEGPLPCTVRQPARILQHGLSSVSWMAEIAWGRSIFWLTTTIYADSPRIDCHLRADWLEKGLNERKAPMMRVLHHLAEKPENLICDVPFAVLEREPGREVPAQKWASVETTRGSLALFNRGKYGYALRGGVLSLSLLRSFSDPDVYPDLGRHEIHWALLPYAGNWLEAGLPRKGAGYNVPLETYQARKQSGTLCLKHSFLEVLSEDHFVVTGIKQAEDGGGWVVRGYDASGMGARVVVKTCFTIRKAEEINLLEEPLPESGLEVKNGEVLLTVRPWGIVAVKIA